MRLTCASCNVEKDEEEFSRDRRRACGRQRECKACASVRMRAWYESLTPEQREAKRAYQREHRRNNPAAYRWTILKSKYGLTRERFEKLLAEQGGKCAICGTDTPGADWTQFCVDHDHRCCPGAKSCGRCVRGLLCRMCNHALGLFGDDPRVLAAAAVYLTAHAGDAGLEHD